MKKINVVYALIYNKESDQVLMVCNKDQNDTWSLPGGLVEDNETLEQALIREVKEETGIFIKIKNVASINERIFKDNDVHAQFITFNVEVIGGVVSFDNPDEISEIEWIDIKTADKLMTYHPEGIRKLLFNTAIYHFQGYY